MKSIKIPLFVTSNYVRCFFDEISTEKYFKKIGFNFDLDCSGLFVYPDTEQSFDYAICVFDGSISTLVHECWHATQRILEDVGNPVIEGAANETHAYMMEFLFKECIERFEEYKRENPYETA